MTRPRKRRAYIRKIVRSGCAYRDALNEYYKDIRGDRAVPITDIFYYAGTLKCKLPPPGRSLHREHFHELTTLRVQP